MAIKRIVLVVPVEEHKEFKEVCWRNGKSMTEVLLEGIRKEIENGKRRGGEEAKALN